GEVMTPEFPGVGHIYECDFGEFSYQIYYLSGFKARLTFSTGLVEYVRIFIFRLCPRVYSVHWQESDSTVVSQFQDFGENKVYSVSTFHRSMLARQGFFRKIV